MASNKGSGSGFVAADAQFSAARVLKPFDGFESVYQGLSAVTPIAMPGTLDPNAGTPGYAANLLAGLPVPLGSRVMIWIPAPCGFLYFYKIVWRMRSLRDFRNPAEGQPRGAYHIPQQRPGVVDTSFVPPQPRVQIPAAFKVLAYEQPEVQNQPCVDASDGVINIVREAAVPSVNPSEAPILLPDGNTAIIQQGILDPGNPSLSAFATFPVFAPFWFDAEGDDMIVLVTKSASALDTWDFTDFAEDRIFSDIYGTGNGAHAQFPGSGILVFTGTNP